MIVVPLFRWLKLCAVLGYLAAGAIIGPWGLDVVPHAEATFDFAELGVVLLLFLVGLDEALLIETVTQAAAQLQELFESDGRAN